MGRIPETFLGPSGRLMSEWEIMLWCDLEENGSFGWNPEEITFNSGFKCHAYLSMRNELSDNPMLLHRVGVTMLDRLMRLKKTHGPEWCLIGIPTAGTQLAQAVSTVSVVNHLRYGREDEIVAFRSLRSVQKKHGKAKDEWTADADIALHSYCTVENVISGGGNLLESLDRLVPHGYPVVDMHHLVFADWELGGMRNTAAHGLKNVHAIFALRDVIAAFVEIGKWPYERLEYIQNKLAPYLKA